MTTNWRAIGFHSLPSFSGRQAAAWNAFRRIFAAETSWQDWITEGLTAILESPADAMVRLRQRHTVDPQHAEAVFQSDAGKLTLGRDESCDVRLAPRSVGNIHARLFTKSGRCYIEDLGSPLGTFLNDSRLAPNRPVPVVTGDQFAIFPYEFSVEITEQWVRGAPVDAYAGPLLPLRPRTPQTPVAPDRIEFTIRVEPVGAEFLLEADRGFLEKLSAQVLAPLSSGAIERLGLTSADIGLFECIAAAVLERINRDLRFPLQAALAAGCSPPVRAESGGGVAFSFAIRVAELTGTFRLSIRDQALPLLGVSEAPPALNPALSQLSWTFPLSAGYADLTREEVALIEPSDVVLLDAETAILFRNLPDRGWRLLPRTGNLSHAVVDKYFERNFLSQSEGELGSAAPRTAPDLSGLPIRMHAIIGEKEMTLAEANLMIPGAIVELDRTKSDPVRISLNGKITGTGELVEVDGRLGLRVVSWKAPS